MAEPGPVARIARWIEYRLPVFSAARHALVEYRTPRNLNAWWNFGSIAGFFLVLQIVTGIVLAMHYTAHVDHAFDSIQHITRDVNYGWLIRSVHVNGASFFFIAVYLHTFRGLYYGSYKEPRELLWWLGLVILILMMMTAFTGYVLPWGQMSFWAATVITNLFSAVPGIGEAVVEWLWGGYAVDQPTLGRFFALHYLLPFVIVAAVALHLVALHRHGSNNPLGIPPAGPRDTIPFHPYYTAKDLVGLGMTLVLFAGVVFYAPDYLGHPDNYVPADPLVTPPHIVPEWYFLPFYAILRAIPDKLGGVVAMFGALLVLFAVPWLDTSKVRSASFRPIYKWLFWLLALDVVVLGWVGANPPEGHFILLGRIATAWYFLHFLVLMPVVGRIERPRPLPEAIAPPPGGGGP